MYYFNINTKGIIEHFTTRNVSKIHRKVNEILQNVSLSYTPQMFPSIRTLQQSLKELKLNDKLIFNIELSKITIIKNERL